MDEDSLFWRDTHLCTLQSKYTYLRTIIFDEKQNAMIMKCIMKLLSLFIIQSLISLNNAAESNSFKTDNDGDEEDKKKPNLVIVMTDQQSLRTLGCYRNILGKDQSFLWGEGIKVDTPNIDRLANEGALFANWYVTTPVCTPSRASFMTGVSKK